MGASPWDLKMSTTCNNIAFFKPVFFNSAIQESSFSLSIVKSVGISIV
jgi:hypothetical protein